MDRWDGRGGWQNSPQEDSAELATVLCSEEYKRRQRTWKEFGAEFLVAACGTHIDGLVTLCRLCAHGVNVGASGWRRIHETYMQSGVLQYADDEEIGFIDSRGALLEACKRFARRTCPPAHWPDEETFELTFTDQRDVHMLQSYLRSYKTMSGMLSLYHGSLELERVTGTIQATRREETIDIDVQSIVEVACVPRSGCEGAGLPQREYANVSFHGATRKCVPGYTTEYAIFNSMKDHRACTHRGAYNIERFFVRAREG
jgi:hypothetical protein